METFSKSQNDMKCQTTNGRKQNSYDYYNFIKRLKKKFDFQMCDAFIQKRRTKCAVFRDMLHFISTHTHLHDTYLAFTSFASIPNRTPKLHALNHDAKTSSHKRDAHTLIRRIYF